MPDIFRELWIRTRHLLRSPAFAGAVVLCLGLAIGANTAVFSLMNGMFFRPLPVPDAGRIVRLYVDFGRDQPWGAFSYPNYKDLRESASQTLESFALEMAVPFHLGGPSGNQEIWGAVVSENYFSTLGVAMALGSPFADGSTAPGSNPTVVLSHGTWRTVFGSDVGVIGKRVTLNGHTMTVIGVGPPQFTGTLVGFEPGLWVPAMMAREMVPGEDLLEERGAGRFLGIGRLRPGATARQAEEQLSAAMARLAEIHPDFNEGLSINVLPEREGALHPSLRGGFLLFFKVLLAVVLLALLVACFNLAVLFLVRAARRRKEIAMRLALGISYRLLVWQTLAEVLILTLTGAGVGLLLAGWIVRGVARFNPTNLPISFTPEIDLRVLGFTSAVTVLTVLTVSLAPIFTALKTDLVSALKDLPSAAGQGAGRMQGLFLVAQVSLSLILLIAAGLFLRSLAVAQKVDPGFEIGSVLTGSVNLGLQGYDQTRGLTFYDDLVARLRSQPAATSVSLAATLPFELFGRQRSVTPEGYEAPAGKSDPIVGFTVVAERYFKTLGISFLAGRDFEERDGEVDAPAVAIVNRAFVERFWPNFSVEETIDKRIGTTRRIVGVVETVKIASLGEPPTPFVYISFRQSYEPAMNLLIATAGDPTALGGPLREEVRLLDPNLPVTGVEPLAQQLSTALLPARLGAVMLGGFGGLTLLLTAVGLYGTMAYAVSQRTREIGIRRALGASTQHVLRATLGRSGRLAAIGLVLGLVGAFFLTQALAGLLYGVSPLDPLTFLMVVLFLLCIVGFASLLPGRRAARIDPVEALREG